MKDVFGIKNFNVIQDKDYYYLFRALNMADNEDYENNITSDENGNIVKIRTDKSRWHNNEVLKHDIIYKDKTNKNSTANIQGKKLEQTQDITKIKSCHGYTDSKEAETDKERFYAKQTKNVRSIYEGQAKRALTLEEMYDHIKPNYCKNTDCISLSTSAEISIKYGRESYKDRYIIVRAPKYKLDGNNKKNSRFTERLKGNKSFEEHHSDKLFESNKQIVIAGKYMLEEIEKRINESIDFRSGKYSKQKGNVEINKKKDNTKINKGKDNAESNKEKDIYIVNETITNDSLLNEIERIKSANTTKDIIEIILTNIFSIKEKKLNNTNFNRMNKKLNTNKRCKFRGKSLNLILQYAPFRMRFSNYGYLTDLQTTEKNKVIGVLTLLELKYKMKPLMPNTKTNDRLLKAIENAFSSKEIIHYGEIEQEEIIQVTSEEMDKYAELQKGTYFI